jgi:hypothetical protein
MTDVEFFYVLSSATAIAVMALFIIWEHFDEPGKR